MTKERIIAEKANARTVSDALWRGLVNFNRAAAGRFRYSRAVLTARDDKGRIAGGLILESYWNSSYVELLWMSKRARGRGYGRRLMQEAERRARRRGSTLIHLNTFSFQAPRFYEKLGYECFGSIRSTPPGASRHFYIKRLARA